MTDQELDLQVAVYRQIVSAWSDSKFRAACEQACDDTCFNVNDQDSQEWAEEFLGHLDCHCNGSAPVMYAYTD